MIRVQLRARSTGSRRGLVWGMCLGGLLGAGAAWLASSNPATVTNALRDGRAALATLVTAAPTPARPPATADEALVDAAPVDEEVPVDEAARGRGARPRATPAASVALFAGSDAPRRAIDLATEVPASATVQLVVGAAQGGWAIEGRTASAAELVSGLDRLRRRTVEARLTQWRSGGDDQVRFRYAGRILGADGPPLAPLDEVAAAEAMRWLRGLAEAGGLQGVAAVAESDSSLGGELHLRRWSLRAAGAPARIRRLLQDLETFGGQLCLSRIDLVPGTTGQQLHARIDMLVTSAGDER